MNTRKITSLRNKAEKEAKRAVEKIYKKYDAQMNELLAQETPKGYTLRSGNGMMWIEDKKGDEVTSGRAWGFSDGENPKLNELSELQYFKTHEATFTIKDKIKGKKV